MFDKVWELAQKASINGDIPVGAVIVNKNDEIIGCGYNTRFLNHDIAGHAEINAINSVNDKYDLTDTTIYVNLEPCPMCAEAIKTSKIKKVIYNIDNSDIEESKLVYTILKKQKLSKIPTSEENLKIFNDFFESLRK